MRWEGACNENGREKNFIQSVVLIHYHIRLFGE
jgi:hypothetical protein